VLNSGCVEGLESRHIGIRLYKEILI
jgi:hypothetical protein